MPRKKKVIEISTDIPQAPIMEQEVPILETEVAVEESEAKKQFRIFIEEYKQKNPAKFAQKESELLKKLNSL